MSTKSAFVIDDHALDVLFREAHTTHAFADKEVPEETLRAVRELVKWGPTSMNNQPLRIIEVPKDQRERLLPAMMGGNKAKTEAAPLVYILAADTNFHEYLPQQFPAGGDGPREMYAADAASRFAVANQSANLQAAYFILGLRAAGLGVGPMGGFDRAAVAQEFLDEGEQAILVLIAGFPAEEDAYFDRGPRLDDSVVYRVAQ